MAFSELRSAARAGIEQQKRSSGRRSHLEIRMDILGTVSEGDQGPTQIMYRSNLSWAILSQELRGLIELGLIESKTTGDRKRYFITSRGVEIVSSYRRVISELQVDAPVSVIAN